MGTHQRNGTQPGVVAPEATQDACIDVLASLGALAGNPPDVDPKNDKAKSGQALGDVRGKQYQQRDFGFELPGKQDSKALGLASDPTTSVQKRLMLEAIRELFPGTDCPAQERRLLAALQIAPVDTFEASRYLDVYYPPARVMALRKKGHEIPRLWKRVPTECGRLHRIGNYMLIKGVRDAI